MICRRGSSVLGTILSSICANVNRIISAWYFTEQDQDSNVPGVGLPKDLRLPHKSINAKDPASKSTILDGAIQGHVLVKNNRGALPLKSPKILSVFGYDATAPDSHVPGDLFSFGFCASPDSIGAALGAFGIDVDYVSPVSQIGSAGTLIVGGGSGSNSPAYINAPLDALRDQAYADGSHIFWDTFSLTPTIPSSSDACLVFINAFATEGTDRPGLHDDESDSLIKHVATSCNNTIVVIHNAGVRLVDQFANHPNVTAIIFAHLPGQDSGRAIVSLLYGNASFSGKLPYTVPKNESDYGPLDSPLLPVDKFVNFPQDDFEEGLYIDYRHFNVRNITPRYEFGFGLTYTTFNLSDILVSKITNCKAQAVPNGVIMPGGRVDLWDIIMAVEVKLTNIGGRDGAEVVQLYVGIPAIGTPARQLRGFEKVDVPFGRTKIVRFSLTRRDLSVWDTTMQEWILHRGEYQIYVGSSSRDLPLSATITI